MDEEFEQLLGALEQLLEQRAKLKAPRRLLDLAERRFQLESRLIARLRSDPGTAPEKRKNARVPCDLKGRVRIEGATTHACAVRNLSCGGVLLELPVDCPLGTLMEVAIEPVPGLLNDGIVLRGQAAWVRGREVGVRFLGANEGSDRRIFALVLALLRQRVTK